MESGDRSADVSTAPPTRLLILSKYDRQGASSRLRSLQYLPYLSEAGFETQVESLFDAEYLSSMYMGRTSPISLLRYLKRRVRQMHIDTDLIWLEKEALPWVPWPFEHALWPRGTPVVVDYDDAVFHRYDLSRHSLVRLGLGRKIDRVMARAQVVVAGNQYLANRADIAGAAHVEMVPTVVDASAYAAGVGERLEDRPRIGWIGTPETWRSFAQRFAPIFGDVAKREGGFCRLIGAEPEPSSRPPFEYLPWTEAAEISLIKGMDVGMMPLPDTPWTRGKCGYKLIQYMACGLPVVASPVGVNTEIVEHGVNGFLADTEDEWRSALSLLLRDPGLRKRMGEAGQRKVEVSYSLESQGPRLAQILRNVADSKIYSS